MLVAAIWAAYGRSSWADGARQIFDSARESFDAGATVAMQRWRRTQQATWYRTESLERMTTALREVQSATG